MNIAFSVQHNAIRHPARVAVEEDGGRQLTYAALWDRSRQVANMLTAHGVRPGDRVSYFMLNRLEIVEILVGCAAINAVAAPLNFRLDDNDLQAILSNCQPRVIVTEGEFLEKVSGIARELDCQVLSVGTTYDRSLTSASATSPERLGTTSGDSPALLQYTSGTTGRSKGATFTHNAILMHAANAVIEYGMHDKTRTLVCIPHNSAVNIQIAPALYRGSTIVLTDPRAFDGARWLDRVSSLGITSSQVVPTMLYRALEANKQSPVKLSAVECIGYGSAPMPPDRVEELLAAFGSVFVQLYGMIEIAAIGTMLRPADHDWALREAPEVLASVGQPSYGIDVRVVDDGGSEVPQGTRGEIAFKSPYMMTGYWEAPSLTADAIRNGWLHSGDIGEYRDGWLYVVDRKKDIIIRGGQNVASKEVEDAIAAHPAVMEVAAFGIPSREWGEEIMVAVMTKAGCEVSADDLVATCRKAGLARFKTPARFEFVDELPRNAIGKVQKSQLRTRFAGSQ